MSWANGDAATAAGTCRSINLRSGYADGIVQANGLRGTSVDTRHAKNVVLGEAAVVDGYLQLPWRIVAAVESASGAGTHAFAAECAFAEGKIDAGKSAIAGDDDVARTCFDAVIAARAAVKEILFR
jgi:hypothetical protein